MPPKLFTLEEALALLPRVRQLLSDIQASKREMERLAGELERLLALSGGNGHLAADVASTQLGNIPTLKRLR
jgi:DNA-binding transcriptional LysR family regulator